MRYSLLVLLLQPAVVPTAANDRLVASGCCFDRTGTSEVRLQQDIVVVPGLPPAFSFRQLEGEKQQRFSHSELLLDDAGH